MDVAFSIRESHGLAFNTENVGKVVRVFLGVSCSACKRLSPEILDVLSRHINAGTCVIIYLVDDSDQNSVRMIWRESTAGDGMKALIRHYSGVLIADNASASEKDAEFIDYMANDLRMAQSYGIVSVPTIVVTENRSDKLYRLDDIKKLSDSD